MGKRLGERDIKNWCSIMFVYITMFLRLNCFLIVFEIFSQGFWIVDSGIIKEALHLGQISNATREDCIWRTENDVCSSNFVKFTLYTRNNGDSNHGNVFECDDQVDINRNSTNQVSTAWCSDDDLDDISFAEININSPAWLHSSSWNPSHETVVLIHGYGGTADHLPAGVLRDAYLRNGSYNVIVVDWGPLAKLPCYVASVHNIKNAAKCVSELFTFLRNSGVDMRKTSCIGHSLGAHVCGVTANFLTFRLHKIIGLDPAKPLIPNASKSKLDVADAEMVQVLHTSSNYGDSKKMGHVDFYFNGGRTQPFCANATDEELCSHLRSVCYLAESIFPFSVKYGTKCKRRNVIIEENPRGLFNRISNAHFVPVGQPTPDGAIGTYCVTNVEAPFCSVNKMNIGSPFCCSSFSAANSKQILKSF